MLSTSRNYFTVVISSYVFFVKEGEILLSRRYNTGYRDGEYSIPAGHIEEGEFASPAAVREAKEEVGVDIDETDLHPAHIMHRHCGDHDRIDFFFTAKKWSGEVENAEPDRCDEIRWCNATKLPENTIPYIKVAIGHFLDGKFYSEFSEPQNKVLT